MTRMSKELSDLALNSGTKHQFNRLHQDNHKGLKVHNQVLSALPLPAPLPQPLQSLQQLLQAPGPWLLLQNLAHGSVFPRV